ncbi:reverse transcriptase domain-containing protein [Tanacetum coccineum]
MDGSSCLEGSGVGLILTNPEGEEFTYALRFEFDASNNEEEYEALIAGLRIGEQIGIKNLIAKVDSRLQVLVETLKRKSIEEREILAIIEEGYCWMTLLVDYLTEGILPVKAKKARTIRIKARQYAMINGVLYKKSFLEPWLRCVGPVQAEYVVKEKREGSCSMHSGPRSVVAKAITSGYYRPAMHKDARNIIRTCNDCQTHRLVPRNPQQKLTPITSPWPFYKWGIDISGTEAVIPVEIGMPSLRCAEVNQTENDERLLLNLDMLEERRERAAVYIFSRAGLRKFYLAGLDFGMCGMIVKME